MKLAVLINSELEDNLLKRETLGKMLVIDLNYQS